MSAPGSTRSTAPVRAELAGPSGRGSARQQSGRAARVGDRAPSASCRGQDGQTVPLSAAVITLAVALAMALVSMGSQVVDAARASTAADAAALAAVAASPDRARSVAATVAEQNGAHLLTLLWDHNDVIVEVRLGTADAQARARLVLCGSMYTGCSS